MKKIDDDTAIAKAAERMQYQAKNTDRLAKSRGARAITIVYHVIDDDRVEAGVIGGCCQYHTIRALTEAIAIVAGAGRDEEDHLGLDDDDGGFHNVQ
jgi:hypothetical protein